MSTKAVILQHTTPVRIDHFLAALFGTNTVLPVVFIRKAASRPAEYRNLHFFQSFHHICPHSVFVRNLRIFSHIDSFINAPSQML